MRLQSLVLALFLAAFAAAEEKSGPPNGPPKGAEQIAPRTYRHKDQAGKVWIYRQTPFGYAKTPEEATPEKPENASSTVTPFGKVKNSESSKPGDGTTPFGGTEQSGQPAITKAVEEGDTVRFERPSPFGPSRWTRKKAELTAAEREAWERLRKPTAESTSGKSNSR